MPRRLSSRRGSAAAADPLAAAAAGVQSSSTLTIVRLAPHPEPAHPRRRLSFAVTSFGPPSPARPSSPHRPRLHLSPDQLVDLARSSTHQHSTQTTAPPTFTPLPDQILLPFIDRPSEVAALISSPPSAKLFSLLEKTLAPITEPSSDPSLWSYPQLLHHLTHVSRQQSPDAPWVLQVRRCIISHSESIWERVKGALGVPPELDLDPDPSEFDYSSSHSSCSIDTDEISDDHGRSARGHWEDWDAIMDSPVYDRRHSGPGSPLPLSLTRQEDDHSRPDPSAESTEPFFSTDHCPSTFVSIEPLLSPSSHAGTLPSSETAAGGLGLDDIQEGAEEEEEEPATDDTPTEKTLGKEPADPHLISPSQIQGLRISTTPISLADLSGSVPSSAALPVSSSLARSPALPNKPLSPISPLPPYHYPTPRSRPTSGTFVRPQLGNHGPAGLPPVFRRSGSSGSLMSIHEASDGHASSADGAAFERVHGSPLFPSSFARLSGEPTLGERQRTYSHGAGGGTVAGYKRLSWGAAPPVPVVGVQQQQTTSGQ